MGASALRSGRAGAGGARVVDDAAGRREAKAESPRPSPAPARSGSTSAHPLPSSAPSPSRPVRPGAPGARSGPPPREADCATRGGGHRRPLTHVHYGGLGTNEAEAVAAGEAGDK